MTGVPIVAGVDSSTQSSTVQLRDADDGRLLGAGSAPHPAVRPPRSEHNPAEWWSALRTALAAAVADAGVTAYDIDAIAVDGQCHGLVALGTDGTVLRPAKLWNDTESAPQARALVERLGADFWAGTVGSVPTAAFTVTKLAWLAEHEPATLRRLGTVLLPHDWLTYRLCGRAVTDRSEASGTGYFSAREGRWLPEVLALVDDALPWPDLLPAVCGPDEPAGTVSAAAAAATGLRAGIPVGPGAGDQHAAALGLGVGPGDLVFSLGTSGVAFARAAEPVADPTGIVNGVADATGGYLPLVCTLNCTLVTDLFATLLGVDLPKLAELALAAPADADRPVLAPYLGAERTPDLPDARGLLGGLRLGTTRAQLARAGYEGVLLGLLDGADALRRVGVDTSGRVLATGGGSRSPAYTQLLADLTGRAVTVLDVPDASVRGACVQAAAILRGDRVGELAASWAPARTGTVEPRPGPDAGWLRDRYQRLAGWSGHTEPWRGRP